jgi:trk system potassium uptake protein TrkA
MEVTVLEADRERCRELASLLPHVNVICGDVREQSLLESEGIEAADALVTLTRVDELNMVLSLYGNSREVPQIVTQLETLGDTGITEHMMLGSVICPRRLCCNNIVRYVRAMQNQTGAAVTIHSIADGKAEAMEFVVDASTLHCGEPLKRIKLRRNILLVSITSKQGTVIPNGDSSFGVGDRVVVVASGDTVIGQLNDIFA